MCHFESIAVWQWPIAHSMYARLIPNDSNDENSMHSVNKDINQPHLILLFESLAKKGPTLNVQTTLKKERQQENTQTKSNISYFLIERADLMHALRHF